jgi:cell division protein FtsI (penicillin-binding protein 3)
LFFLFSFLIIQYYKIQVIEHAKWRTLADKQHFFLVKEPFKRGRFFSNTSLHSKQADLEVPLVYDIQKFHLYIDPLSIPEAYRTPIIDKIYEIVKPRKSEKKKIADQFQRKSRSRRLALWLSHEQQSALTNWWNGFIKGKRIPKNALYFTADYKRSYPFGPLLGQVLHTVQDDKEEKTGQMIPTGGLELQFDKYLRGSPGLRRLMRSPRNVFDTGELLQAPEDGADVYLTVNHVLQAIAEEEIERGVKDAEALSGWAIVLDPWTGEILALAQYPYFYPEYYRYYFNDPLKIQHTRVRAITDAVEPGSVMKPLNYSIALVANRLSKKPLFDPEELVATTNTMFPGRSKPLADTTPRPFLNMNMAVAKSSNVYIARVVEKVIAAFGAPWYREMLTQLGLAVPTGVELPSESWGFLPTPGKRMKNGMLEWLQGTPPSLSIGYSLQVNYMQLARAFSVIANGGKLIQPTFVRKIVKGDEVLLDNTSPERWEQAPRVMPEDVAARVLTAMKYVTKPGGSAFRGDVIGYSEAGKSGTSKKNADGKYSDYHYRATFIGITPANKPRLVILAGMDEPKYGYVPGIGKKHNGGVCTAMVFSRLAARALEYLQVPPDDIASLPKSDRRYKPGKKDWSDENRLLQEMYKK